MTLARCFQASGARTDLVDISDALLSHPPSMGQTRSMSISLELSIFDEKIGNSEVSGGFVCLDFALAHQNLQKLSIDTLTLPASWKVVTGGLFENFPLVFLESLELRGCWHVRPGDIVRGVSNGHLPRLRQLTVEPCFGDREWVDNEEEFEQIGIQFKRE